MPDPSILIFGAGKIGRSFIGQIFGGHGYRVVFVDMDQALVKALNRRKQYPVLIKGPVHEERIVVKQVRAIHALDREKVVQAISEASIIAISVGKNALSAVAKVISEGLKARENMYPGRKLDIILAENMRSADQFFREKLREALSSSFPLDMQVGLVESSIGKMVPIMTAKDLALDPLQVFAEPYNTLILDRQGFRGEIPDFPELALKENMKAWVDRKAFIHNLGHATAAYFGFLKCPDAVYLYEVLEAPQVLQFTRGLMLEAADILIAAYPGEFTQEELAEHIDDLLERFRNRKLGDTLFRVGSDLHRKLGADDRFMAPIRMAQKYERSYELILKALSMGFSFAAKDEQGKEYPGDAAFHTSWKQDPDRILEEVCGLSPVEDADIVLQLKSFLFE